MKKTNSFVMAAALAGLALGGSLLDIQTAHAQASATTGSLRGVIKDKGSNGDAAAGATVVATSPALQGEQVVITDDSGQYFLTALPPGVYTLTVYYNDGTFSRGNVLIQLGKEAVVNVTVDTGAKGQKGDVVIIKGTAPIVDQGSTKTGLTITEDFTRNIPTARTFGGVVGAAAGSQGDNYGISLSGATSVENTYIVEGINTTDTGFGGLSSNLPTEFISETEVISGGYNAEFGRATGGIINVVTKQGGNEFHGSVYGYYKPGALVAPAKLIAREGGSIDSKTDLDYQYDMGAEVGGPIIKDKLWFHIGFNPSISHSTTTRIVQSQVDKDGDGVPDVDENGFTIHENVDSREIPRDFKTYFFTAKINGAINQNNQFQISAFGNPRNAQDVFGLNRNPDFSRFKYDDGAYDLSAKYTSKFNDGKTEIGAVVGYHNGYEKDKPFSSAQDVPIVFYNYSRSLYDFADLEDPMRIAKCNDADPSDPYPMIQNCPVVQYAEQGLGFLEERTNGRTSGTISLTQRVKLAGYHVFKAGIDGELATYDSTRRYTGGEYLRRSPNTAAGAPGRWQQRQFMKFKRNLTEAEAADPGSVMLETGEILCANDRAICEVAPALHADTNNTNLGAYIQDSWQIRPNITVNAGLRWEQTTGFVAKALQGKLTPDGETIPEAAYKLSNMLAPRIGFIYDPTQEGRAKIFGHWGRFYENVPMDLNVRSFGGEITNFTILNFNRRTMASGAYDPNCDADHGTPDLVNKLNSCSDTFPQALLGEGIEFVSPNIKGQHTDELILGTEYEIIPDFKIGANYIHRTLPIVIEDVSTDGGNSYLITNPGENFDAEAADLQKKAEQLMMSTNPQDQALGQVYANRASQLAYVKHFDKPSRNYDALQLTLTQRPTKASLLQASYTYAVEKGNYPGLFSTETGQLDPNITSLYDLPDLMANRYGFLGLDRPHNLKIDGFYAFDLKAAGLLVAGASFRAQSGIAHNALGSHPTYGTGESYLLPRGAYGRSPVTSNLDVHLSYGRFIDKKRSTKIEGFANIFNLFNQQDELNQDENYTYDNAVPIVGGTASDLRHLKAHDENGIEQNVTVTPNKNFGHTGTSNATIVGARQAPRTIQFGLRVTF